MRVVVCGGRTFADEKLMSRLLDFLSLDDVLVNGDAPGADRLAKELWQAGGNVVETYRADWDLHGKAAGPIRNQRMLDTGVDLVIAFPGEHGTDDMVRRAVKAGVLTLRVCV